MAAMMAHGPLCSIFGTKDFPKPWERAGLATGPFPPDQAIGLA